MEMMAYVLLGADLLFRLLLVTSAALFVMWLSKGLKQRSEMAQVIAELQEIKREARALKDSQNHG